MENSQDNAHNTQDENPPAGTRKLGDASSSSSAAELPQDLTAAERPDGEQTVTPQHDYFDGCDDSDPYSGAMAYATPG